MPFCGLNIYKKTLRQMHVTEILIIEDHPIVLMGIKALLANMKHLHISDAKTGADAVKQMQQRVADIAIVDIELPDMSGFDIVTALRNDNPNIAIVFYTQHDELWNIAQMEQMNPAAVVHKSDDTRALRTAVERVIDGRNYYSKRMGNVKKHECTQLSLSKREQQVLRMIADGLTTQQMAKKLYLSNYTIEYHRKHILQKFGAQNSAELIRNAIKCGYIKA